MRAERDNPGLLPDFEGALHLAESTHAQLDAVIEAMADGLIVFDMAGNVVLVNEAEARIFGFAGAIELKRDLAWFNQQFELFDESGAPLPPEQWPTARGLRGESFSDLEIPVRRVDDGREWIISFSGGPVRDKSGNQVFTVTITRDVSRRRRAEDELRTTKQWLELVLNGISDGFVSYDRDFRFCYIGKVSAERLSRCGRDASQLLGKVLWDEFPELIGTRVERHLRRAMMDRVPVSTEAEIDGRWYEQRVYPTEDGGLSTLTPEITDRKRHEASLHETVAGYRQLAEALPQMVWIARPDGEIEYWNQRCAAYTGMSPADSHDQRWSTLLHPDDRAPAVAGWRRSVATGEPFEIEYRIRGAADGAYRWFLVRALPLRDGAGDIVRWFGTSTEIDELKQVQAELSEAKARLEEVDKNRNDFLAMLSHELRNPLAPIRNSVWVLERAAPGSPEAREAVGVIDRQTVHLKRLTDDLLDATRVARGKIRLERERLQLGDLLRRVVADHLPLFVRQQVALAVDIGDQPFWVHGDPTRLAQIVGNLLCNAAKFTPPGGHAWLSLTREQPGQALLRIRDDGCGMTAETLAQIFEPFVQGDRTIDRSHGGLGLGLAVVKRLAEMHGGTVAASSDGTGHGSAFCVRLPVEPAETVARGDAHPPLPTAAPAPHAAPARRVLIVEDNLDAADALTRALSLSGHVVAVAHDGAAGLREARAFAPDVVLCDIGLPGMDGYEFARTLRADPQLAGVHLVALSGYAQREDLERSRAAGFDRHVAKPPEMRVLAEVLRSAPTAPRPAR